jgi:hypothetical protein
MVNDSVDGVYNKSVESYCPESETTNMPGIPRCIILAVKRCEAIQHSPVVRIETE